MMHGSRHKTTDSLMAIVCIAFLFATIVSHAQGNNVPLTSEEQNLLKQVQQIPSLLADKTLAAEQIPNPHWREDACHTCHRGKPKPSKVELINDDINQLCNNCHKALSDHSIIHPVGMVPLKEMRQNMPKVFRDALQRGGGEVTCINCHDLPMQCLENRRRERGLNPKFILGGPYRNRTDLCFDCHIKQDYQRLNAHKQITNNGQPRKRACQVCHSNFTGLKAAKSIAEVSFHVADNNLSAMCTGCHPWIPHPGGAFSFSKKSEADHLVVPSDRMMLYMEKMATKNNVSMPVQPADGRIFCATCHNPHEKGVRLSPRVSTGTDLPKKLRLGSSPICLQCHDK